MKQNEGFIACYTREATSGNNSKKRAFSLHLAFADHNGKFEPLNYNTGVLYTKAQFAPGSTGTTKLLKDPYIFRTKEGKFGIVASRVDEEGEADEQDCHGVLMFISEDLVNYTELGFKHLTNKVRVMFPVCEYEEEKDGYRIGWQDETGKFNSQVLSDFRIDALSKDTDWGSDSASGRARIKLSIEGTQSGVVLPVSLQEAQYVLQKLSPVTHTGLVESDRPFHLQIRQHCQLNKEMLPTQARLTYSDGSFGYKAIEWEDQELLGLSTDITGTFFVTGTICQMDYPFPLISNKADPNVVQYKNSYYFISTDENGQNNLFIRQASNIAGLVNAEEHLVLKVGHQLKSCLWAPELHLIEDRLCIFFAAGLKSGAEGWKSVQCMFMRLKHNGNPLCITDWEIPERVVKSDYSPVIENETGISLDMTCFEHKGGYYVIWAQRDMLPMGPSELWIATINPHKPWVLGSEPVKICTPEYGWDRNTTDVNEGPYVIKNKGKLYCTFSGSNIDETYCVGLLTADADADLLMAESWSKTGYPIWTSEAIEQQYGPGHNSYVNDENGNLINIFHAKLTVDGSRDFGARMVHWAVDGTPVLDMTIAREILPTSRQVQLRIDILPIKEESIQTSCSSLEPFEILYAYLCQSENNRKGALCLALESTGKTILLNEGQPVLYSNFGLDHFAALHLSRHANGSLELIVVNKGDNAQITIYKWIDSEWINQSSIPINEVVQSDQVAETILYSYLLKHGLATAGGNGVELGGRISISNSEYDSLFRRYSKPSSTNIIVSRTYSLEVGGKSEDLKLPNNVAIMYSDGSDKRMGIEWYTENVNWNERGSYKIGGIIKEQDFVNPFIRERADPYVYYDKDSELYYFTASYPTFGHDSEGRVQAEGYDRIILRCARTLEQLADAKEVIIWQEQDSINQHCYIWAPEIHRIAGRWYLLFSASSDKNNVWGIRPVMLQCKGDVMNPKDWSINGQWVKGQESDRAFSAFSLDMTYFEHRGRHYVVWAEKPDGSKLFMASIDPEEPWKLTSRSIELTSPNFSWEQAAGDKIDEGPAVIINKEKVFVFFSACTVDYHYCIGYLWAHIDADLLDPKSWIKNPYPILSTEDFTDGQQGPGHNSFTKDQYGNWVIVYHARTKGEEGDGGLDDPGRHTRMKGILFTKDNRPILNLFKEEELNPEHRNIECVVEII
jgi:GH43 family beta-xylosidase